MSYLNIKESSVSFLESTQETIENTAEQAESKPKQWIINKLEWLRNLYKKYLAKLNKEKERNKINFIENILRVILNTVDKLIVALQRKLGKTEDDMGDTNNEEEVIMATNMPSGLKDFIRRRRESKAEIDNIFKDDPALEKNDSYSNYYSTKQDIKSELNRLNNLKSHGRKLSDDEKKDYNELSYKYNLIDRKARNKSPLGKKLNSLVDKEHSRSDLYQSKSDVMRGIKYLRKHGEIKRRITRRQMLEDDDEDWL